MVEATTAVPGGNLTRGAEGEKGAKKRGEKIAIAGEGVQRKTVHDGALIGARDCGAQPEVVDSE